MRTIGDHTEIDGTTLTNIMIIFGKIQIEMGLLIIMITMIETHLFGVLIRNPIGVALTVSSTKGETIDGKRLNCITGESPNLSPVQAK